MEEYTEIVNENLFTQNGKHFFYEKVFEELQSFWLCEYQNLVDKLEEKNNELRTYHFCQNLNDMHNIIERSSLFADRIVIPDATVIMGLGLKPENYQNSLKIAYGFLSVVSELTEWINEGIVIVVPNRLNGIFNYSMDKKQVKCFSKYMTADKSSSDYGKRLHAHDMLISSGSYNAVPSTNNPIVWENIIKLIEEDTKNLGSDFVNIAAINSLDLNFLNDVPFDFAKELRDKGYLAELRQYLKTKFKDIETSPNDPDFQYKINEISIDIKDELSMHEHEWDEVKKELRTAVTVKTTSGVVAGTITAVVAGGMSLSSLLGLVGGGIPIASSADDIIRYINNRQSLKKNGIHLFFELKNNKSI